MFAVEDTAAQVTWAGLQEGTVLEAGDASADVGPEPVGAASLEGLPPDSALDLTVLAPGEARRRAGTFRTLSPPPGRPLCRFATVSDLHFGERGFGLLRTIRRPPASLVQTYPMLCTRTALDEALAWGAEAVVVKGDLTYLGKEEEWNEVGPLLAGLPVPVDVVLGNHDVHKKGVDARTALAGHDIVVPSHPFSRDLPGIRIVLAHSAVTGQGGGRVKPDQRRRIAQLLQEAGGPAFLAVHHYPQRFRLPTFYPLGIPGDEASALLDTVVATNPATLVSSGHSHRNRRNSYGPLVIT